MDKNQILNKIKQASEAYYNNEPLIMTDEEYDSLLKFAEEQGWIKQDFILNDNAKIEHKDIKHNIPMLSLKKAKTLEEIDSYFNEVRKYHPKTGFVIEPKLDGLALSLRYKKDEKNSRFNKVCQLVTRGDGEFGEDVSYLLDSLEIKISNFPIQCDLNISEIRGELFCSREDFIFNNQERGEAFSTQRAAVAGILKKAKLGLGYKAKLTFIPYFFFDKDNKEVENHTMLIRAKDLFENRTAKTLDELKDLIKLGEELKNQLSKDYPLDGIVIKPVEMFDMPVTGHHPKRFIAYKYPSATKFTRITGINLSVGKTGKVNPTAIVEPVTLDGVTIQNITLNNFDWIREKDIRIGSTVEATRANDVIPCILRVIDNSNTTKIDLPKNCPYCNSILTQKGKYIICENNQCSSRTSYKINEYAGRGCLDIEGMSGALLEALNITNIVELLKIDYETLFNTKYDSNVSLGENRAKQIYNNIQRAISNTKQVIWLTTLELPSIGQQTANLLLERFGSIDNFFNSLNELHYEANLRRLTSINGIGEITAKEILKNLTRANQLWNQLKNEIGITILEIKNKENKGSFVITGKADARFKNRDEQSKYLEELGFKKHSSIKSDTTYLIIGENPTKSKIDKANKLGIKVLSLTELEKII